MGCFDFTYADNGKNIRGGQGYIYITNALAKAANLPNPIHFQTADEYGNFFCEIDGKENSIDIYAILALEVYLSGHYVEYAHDKEALAGFVNACNAMIDGLRGRSSMHGHSTMIREVGISYFFDKKFETTKKPFLRKVPKIGNQKEKMVWIDTILSHPIPLLITRKKLRLSGEPSEIGQKLGFVSGDDPNQGFSPSKNIYYCYKKDQ